MRFSLFSGNFVKDILWWVSGYFLIWLIDVFIYYKYINLYFCLLWMRYTYTVRHTSSIYLLYTGKNALLISLGKLHLTVVVFIIQRASEIFSPDECCCFTTYFKHINLLSRYYLLTFSNFLIFRFILWLINFLLCNDWLLYIIFSHLYTMEMIRRVMLSVAHHHSMLHCFVCICNT